MTTISISAASYDWYKYTAVRESVFTKETKNHELKLRLSNGDKVAVKVASDGSALIYQEGEERYKFPISADEFKKLSKKMEPFSGQHKESDGPIVSTRPELPSNKQPPTIHLTLTEAKRRKADPTAYSWFRYKEANKLTVKDYKGQKVYELRLNDRFGLLSADPEKGGFFMPHETAIPSVINADTISKLDLVGAPMRLPKKFQTEQTETPGEQPTTSTPVRPPRTQVSPPSDYIYQMKEEVASIIDQMKNLRKMSVTDMAGYTEFAQSLRDIRDVQIDQLKKDMAANSVKAPVAHTILDLLKENYSATIEVLKQKKKHFDTLKGQPDTSDEGEEPEDTETHSTVRIPRETASALAQIGGVTAGSIINLPDEYKQKLKAILNKNLEDAANKRRIKAILDDAARQGHISKIEVGPKPATKPEAAEPTPPPKPRAGDEEFDVSGETQTAANPYKTKADAIKEMKRLAREGAEFIEGKKRDIPIAADLDELDELAESIKGTYDTYIRATDNIVNVSPATKRDQREAIERLTESKKKANTLIAERSKALEKIGSAPQPVVTDKSDAFTPLVDEEGNPTTIEPQSSGFDDYYLGVLKSLVGKVEPYLALQDSLKEAAKDIMADFKDHQMSKTEAQNQLKSLLEPIAPTKPAAPIAKPAPEPITMEPPKSGGLGDSREEEEATPADYEELLGEKPTAIQTPPKSPVKESKPAKTSKSILTADDQKLIDEASDVPGSFFTTLPMGMQQTIKESLDEYRKNEITKRVLSEILEAAIDEQQEAQAEKTFTQDTAKKTLGEDLFEPTEEEEDHINPDEAADMFGLEFEGDD